MPVEWSGLSRELLLELDRRAAEPLRSQLERRLRDAIRSGCLGVGERLPSSRELARELGLSRGLVQDCYAQLQAEGYLTTQVGSATRVAARAAATPGQAVVPRAEPQPPAGGSDAAATAGPHAPAPARPPVHFPPRAPGPNGLPRGRLALAAPHSLRAAATA